MENFSNIDIDPLRPFLVFLCRLRQYLELHMGLVRMIMDLFLTIR